MCKERKRLLNDVQKKKIKRKEVTLRNLQVLPKKKEYE